MIDRDVSIKITLDNSEEISFIGDVIYKNCDLIANGSFSTIFYDIKLSKEIFDYLKNKGVDVCIHYDTDLVFGDISDEEIENIKKRHIVYYLHRKSDIEYNRSLDFCRVIGIRNFHNAAQDYINNELRIKRLEVGGRSEELNDFGNIISDLDKKSLIREIKIFTLEHGS